MRHLTIDITDQMELDLADAGLTIGQVLISIQHQVAELADRKRAEKLAQQILKLPPAERQEIQTLIQRNGNTSKKEEHVS